MSRTYPLSGINDALDALASSDRSARRDYVVRERVIRMIEMSRRALLTTASFAMMRSMVRSQTTAKPQLASVKALVFDTFGTVVDWRSSVIAEGEALGKRKASRRGLGEVRRRLARRIRAEHEPRAHAARFRGRSSTRSTAMTLDEAPRRFSTSAD